MFYYKPYSLIKAKNRKLIVKFENSQQNILVVTSLVADELLIASSSGQVTVELFFYKTCYY